ncbi:MAG: hypothetical protein KJO83_07960 [Bacteroidia bacterium]|nr:hypothetical protein [Bacteroidia bacterium]
MNRKIKLLWDFRGPDSFKIAEHHCIHLKEFSETENLGFYEVNTMQLNVHHSTAFIVVDEKDMLRYRDALRPHRGEVA